MQEIKEKIEKILAEQLNFPNVILETPPNSDWGDLALPCHQFAKQFKKSPTEIAIDLGSKIKTPLIEKTAVAGAYLNIFFNKKEIIKSFFQEEKKALIKNSKKIIIEFLSANPNKPLHIGQARNISIGDALVKIARYLGHQATAANYGDDSGVNVGFNLVGHLYYNYPLETNSKFDHYCGQVYAEMKKKEEEDDFQNKITAVLLAIEKNDQPKITKIHQDYTRRCALAQLESCWRMNVFFDLITWETDILHSQIFQKTFEKLKESGWVKYSTEGESAGCWILDLSQEKDFENTKNPYQILVKSDGVATYVAKDIAYAIWKLGFLSDDFFYQKLIQQPNDVWLFSTTSQSDLKEKNDFGYYDSAIAVIDHRQSYAQSIVRKALQLLGYLDKNKDYRHLSYGVVYLTPQTLIDLGHALSEEEKKEKRLPFSSRAGWIVTIDETLALLEKKAREECRQRNPDKDEKWLQDTAQKIALGALRFHLLKTDLHQDIVFDLKEILDLRGDTGMYILYTYVRLQSILEKFSPQSALNEKMDFSLLNDSLEWEMIKEMLKKEEIIEEAFANLTPNILCNYLLKLSQLFNSYYSQTSIQKSAPPLQIARLALLQKIKITLKEVMNLIGMVEVERV